MKKQMIAFMLSLAMVVASIGGSSVLAAETNGETGITEGSAETADDGVGNDEVDDDEAAVVETTDDAAADDEATVAETADDDEVADDETPVEETADDEVSAILEGPEDTSEEIEPEPAEENREAVADSTSVENVVQAIWTEDNSAITFYYGPIVEEGDYFGEETVTYVWVGDDMVTSRAWLSDVGYDVKSVVFDTSFQAVSLTSMSGWFYQCSDLREVDLRGLNTSDVTDMSKMFHGCERLIELDLSSFDTSNVTDMSSMFYDCNSLKCLDLSNFDTSKVTAYKEMFCGCNNLRTIYCEDHKTNWSWDDSTEIFTDCRSLFGMDRDLRINYSGKNNEASMAKSGYLGGYFTPKYSVYARGKTTRCDIFNLANSVKLTWKAVPGARYYKVYREDITSPKTTPKDPVIVTSKLVGWDTQPGLTNGHDYRYRIVASLTGKGDSSGDSTTSYSKRTYRLKTVAIRSLKNTAPGVVTVKYDKSYFAGDSYVLQLSEHENMIGAKTKVVKGADNTSCVFGGLKKGKTYYISIRVRKQVNGINYYTTFGVPRKVVVTQ